MTLEERFLDAAIEDIEEEEAAAEEWPRGRRNRLQRKNKATIDRFLGNGRRANAVGMLPRYYGELLTWALQRHIESEGWRVVRTLGYRGPEPGYIDVATDVDSSQNLLMNGQLLIEKGDSHFIVTMDINLRWRNWVQVEGPAKMREALEEFICGVMAIAKEQNFYRGKKLEFAGRLRFLDVRGRAWDSIILDAETRAEIRANTVGFLSRRELWGNYGIPLKRGILLAGEPGTGKTAICKVLMAEAEGVTCIATNPYALDSEGYVMELYELAQDLSPSMVFIEDMDLIGQNRMESGYQRGPALLSLLAVLDGIEEHSQIVTVATTNCLDTLDKALSERPCRFDRVTKLPRPSLEQRRELIGRLCRRIPLDEAAQDYIARKAADCTPAQLQEIVYSLVIEHPEGGPRFEFRRDDIDRLLSRINGRNGHHLGFSIPGNGHGGTIDAISARRLD